MWKQLQSTFGPKSCLTCIRSRLLLRAINRHCGMPHSAGNPIPKARYVTNSGMSPKISKLPNLERSADSMRLPTSVKLPASMKSPDSKKSRNFSNTPNSSKSVGSFSIVKGSKLLVKIKPIDSALVSGKFPTTSLSPRTATSLPSIVSRRIFCSIQIYWHKDLHVYPLFYSHVLFWKPTCLW